MSRRRPLPDDYRTSPFTRNQALGAGLPAGRLAAADLERFGRGLYREVGASLLTWGDLGMPDPDHGLDPQSLATLLDATGGALSHQTAAQLYGIPLPGWLAADPHVHITGDAPELRSRRPGISGHRRPLGPADLSVLHGLRCTTPERTWLDLASVVRRGQEEHLVVAGDHLVKQPWTEGDRRPALTTTDRLARDLHRVGRFKGVRSARAALPRIRVGADSPPETLVRLLLIDAGLPEPDLQVHATNLATDRYPADLGYRAWKLALQYDGEHHRGPEQQMIDARRDAWFVRHGWVVIRITVEDLRDDLRSVIRQVRVRAGQVPGAGVLRA